MNVFFPFFFFFIANINHKRIDTVKKYTENTTFMIGLHIICINGKCTDFLYSSVRNAEKKS